MSAYLQFFIKTDTAIVEFASFCRGDITYKIFADAGVPYGWVTFISDNMMSNVQRQIEHEIELNDKRTAALLETKAFLQNWEGQGNYDEVYDDFSSCMDRLDDCNQAAAELDEVKNWVKFLDSMRSDLQYSLTPGRIFAGIEVSLEDFENLAE